MVTKQSSLNFIVFMVFNNDDLIKEEMYAQTDDWQAVINTLTINTSAHHACIDSPHQQTQTLTALKCHVSPLCLYFLLTLCDILSKDLLAAIWIV